MHFDQTNLPKLIIRVLPENCVIDFFMSSLADEERIVRRESYLKATEGGRMHFESDLSDGDISPHVLRR